jgi:2-C-methyl-D-erythritol 4-phosphate cytidylyltransferase
MGVKVKVVAGDYKNIKITTPEDLALAKLFMARSK